jgi:hypothetical protein
MIRLFTSLNWVIGTLAVVAAVIFPLAHEKAFLWEFRNTVETNVKKIAEIEATRPQTNQSFHYFSSSEPGEFVRAMRILNLEEIKAGDFDIQAFSTDNDALVIRAITSLDTMRKGYAPPMMYEYKINRPGEKGTGEWTEFSDAKPGLGFIF